jgi:alkylhydroperoxidase/carboxymuconolactone decarboxylase family protein YurZ
MSLENLPQIVQDVARKYPAVWQAYNGLGEALSAAGPLSSREQRLVKLAIALGAGLQGGVHSHVRRALRDGIRPEEIRHVAVLAITTVGWPAAIARLTWIEDVLPTDE